MLNPEAFIHEHGEELNPMPQTAHQRHTGYQASELQYVEFPPVRYVVPGYIPEGVTIFAGKPKIGKSWACIDIGVSVASGAVVFGNIRCEQGDVLYLALEDNFRRLQSRMKLMYGDAPWPTRLRFETEWPRLDADAVERIREWIMKSEKPTLIIIDTLAKVRGSRNDKDSAYESDYRAISDLQALAGEMGLAIVLVHHVRKMQADDPIDTVSGTLGLTWAADNILVLDRKSDGVTLYGRGRDIEEIETAVRFDKGSFTWKILGKATEVRRSDERGEILECLKQADAPLAAGEIADLMEKKPATVRQMLTRMAATGDIQKIKRGVYAPPDYIAPCHNGHNVTNNAERDSESGIEQSDMVVTKKVPVTKSRTRGKVKAAKKKTKKNNFIRDTETQ